MVNDERMAGAVLRSKARRGQGPARVRQAFQAAGLGTEDVEAAMAESPDWLTLAREVRAKKFGAEIPTDWPTRAKQMRFLQYRGFSKEQISAAFEAASD
jgi:regulatory protein